MRPLAWGLVVALTGCAAGDSREYGDDEGPLAADTGLSLDTAGVEADDDTPQGSLFVLVEPASGEVDGRPLLPHRFGPFLAGAGIELPVRASVTLSGTVTGTVLTPYAATLPTSPVDVPATIRLRDDVTGQAYLFRSDDAGRFSLDVVPGVYEIRVTPDDANVPSVSRPVNLIADTELDLEAGLGQPLWGRLLDAEGTPVPGIEVVATRDDGLSTATTVSDDGGWYELRVGAGVWAVQTRSSPSGREPSLVADPVAVVENASRVDLVYAPVSRGSVSVRVLAADRAPVGGVEATLVARSVRGYAAERATYQVTATTDSRGFLDVRVPNGVYDLEVAPDAEQFHGAVARETVIVDGDTVLTDLDLPPFVTATLVVLDPLGQPVADADLRCTERLGRERSFSAAANLDGEAIVDLPATAVRCLVQPPGARPDLAPALPVFQASADPTAITLEPGGVLDGTVVLDDGSSTQPLDLAVVRILDRDDLAVGFGLTAADGRFEVRIPDTTDEPPVP